ncbi:MAG TPA: polysaccharide deacetylase family protein [Clostridia bacterium]|nr:polysaccharide deacetylase family protein [Clostridia bacterium]
MVIKLNYKIITVIFLILFILFLSPSLLNIGKHPVTAAETSTDAPIRIPIILYHEIRPSHLNNMSITPWEFESDLKFLKKSGYTAINMSDLIGYVNGKGSLPDHPVMITFDDGYLNDYVYAYPLIKKYGVKIVLSVIGKNTEDFSNVSDSNLDYAHVTWKQLNEMSDSGFIEIQNHTYNLHSITRKRFGCEKSKSESVGQYQDLLRNDLSKCQNLISANTGQMPTTFAYPYGSISKEALPVIKSLGFQATFSCTYGINKITKDPAELYGLKRITRYHGRPLQRTMKECDKLK